LSELPALSELPVRRSAGRTAIMGRRPPPLEEIIGRGATGLVPLEIDQVTGKSVAVKLPFFERTLVKHNFSVQSKFWLRGNLHRIFIEPFTQGCAGNSRRSVIASILDTHWSCTAHCWNRFGNAVRSFERD
jgi:hypothetical protein